MGLGEVGKPLFALLSEHYEVVGVDVDTPAETIGTFDVLHICYPFQIANFIGETVRYIDLLKPALTIIDSTVAVGTTRAIAERTHSSIVHSPVRGKHTRMLDELRKYKKFIGASDPASGEAAARHFAYAGINTAVLSSPEASELAKLTETTYFGLLIAWAQEIERYCDQAGLSYDQIVSFYDEIGFFPPIRYFPGLIGGHCVMPNIKLLRQFNDSALLQMIELSNEMKRDRGLHERPTPRELVSR